MGSIKNNKKISTLPIILASSDLNLSVTAGVAGVTVEPFGGGGMYRLGVKKGRSCRTFVTS